MRRKTSAAIIVTATVSILLLGGFVTGAAANFDGTFAWAPQRLGDQGSYSVTLEDSAGKILDQSKPLWNFHIWDAQIILDDDGREHHALRFVNGGMQGSDENDDGIEDSWEPFGPAVYAMDLNSFELVSYSYLTVYDAKVEDGTRYEYGSEQHFYIEEDQLFILNCAMFSPYAGTIIDATEKTSFWNNCDWHDYWAESENFVASERGTYGNLDAIVLKNTVGPTIEVTLVDGIAYPVEMRVEQQNNRGQFHVIRLESFSPGILPIPAPITTLSTEPFDELPTESWGRFPFGSIATPYMLQDAIDDARADANGADFDAWIQEHENWYVYEARNDNQITDREENYRWVFGVTDGNEKIFVDVTQTTRFPATLAPGVEDPTAPEPEETRQITVTTNGPTQSLDTYAREDLPDLLPTLSGVEERWRRYSGETAETSYMSFRTQCTRGCDNVFYYISTGIKESSRNDETGEFRHVFSQLGFKSDPPWGEQWTLYTYHQRATRATVGAVVHSDTVNAESSSAAWTPPSTSFSATVGATGLLAALAVLLVPMSKGGGLLGLFSRIQPDLILESPLRDRIYTTIQSNPGVHMRQLRNQLEIGSGTADHHVRKLVAANLVTIASNGNYSCLFPTGRMNHTTMAAVSAMKAEGAKAIVAILRHGPVLQSELAAQTGIAKGTLSYHLKRLMEAQAINVHRDGRSRRITLTDVGKTAATTAHAA
jgi:predicted transcriptional regulator